MSSKVGFFAWEASWGRVFTLDNLKKRGRTLAIVGASFVVKGKKR